MRILAVFFAALLCCTAGCSSPAYSTENIASRCGWEKYFERDFQLGSVETHNIWHAGVNETDLDYFDFYICNSNAAAKRAFRYMHDNWFEEITDEGDNYVQGWEAGVRDASIEILVYVSDNVVITVEMQGYSEWAVDPDDETDGDSRSWNDADYQQRVKQELFENW